MTPEEILEKYFSKSARISIEEYKEGAINLTYHVTVEESGSERYYKLQKMNSIFDVSLMKDIDFITKRLASKKILTQEVVKTIEGKMFVKDSASWWRMLTYLPGKTFDAMPSPEHAREAGRLVGAFHTALIDCDYQFKFKLPHYHDVPHDMEKLRDALATGSNTPKYAKLKELAESILFHYEKLPQSIALPKRIVHDDLKITNILFADDGKAVALVDIDTFTYGALAVELGDALRSWSMPGGEDGENTHFDINLYNKALEGYYSAAKFLSEKEKNSIPYGVKLMALDLAARFATDALNESYFKLDFSKYKNLFEQNKKRAENQLAFFKEFSKSF